VRRGVAATVLQGKCALAAAKAAEKAREVFKPLRDDMDDIALALHEAITSDHAARQDNPAPCLEQAGPNNQFGNARLVIKVTPVFVVQVGPIRLLGVNGDPRVGRGSGSRGPQRAT
jgi:hypothetical protein